MEEYSLCIDGALMVAQCQTKLLRSSPVACVAAPCDSDDEGNPEGLATSMGEMETVVCSNCGQLFGIHIDGVRNAQVTEKQIAWLQEQFVWDR